MDQGWDSKVTNEGDVIRCIVDPRSITFRFHIGQSMLYTNLQYNRERYLPQSRWQAIDQVGQVDVVSITCEYGDWQSTIGVGKD